MVGIKDHQILETDFGFAPLGGREPGFAQVCNMIPCDCAVKGVAVLRLHSVTSSNVFLLPDRVAVLL